MLLWALEANSFINVIVSFDPLMLAGTLTLANKKFDQFVRRRFDHPNILLLTCGAKLDELAKIQI